MKTLVFALTVFPLFAHAYPGACVADKLRAVSCVFRYLNHDDEYEGGFEVGHVLSLKQNEHTTKVCQDVGKDLPPTAGLNLGYNQAPKPLIKITDDADRQVFRVELRDNPLFQDKNGNPELTNMTPTLDIPFRADSVTPFHFRDRGQDYDVALRCFADDDSAVTPKQVRIDGIQAQRAYEAMASVPAVALPGLRTIQKKGSGLECSARLGEKGQVLSYDCRLLVGAGGL